MEFNSVKENLQKIFNILKSNVFQIPVRHAYVLNKDDNFSNYITYFEVSETNNLFGDNNSYLKIQLIQISVFTEKRNYELEDNIEKLLDNNEIIFEKTSTSYINEEKIYQVIYQVKMPRFLKTIPIEIK